MAHPDIRSNVDVLVIRSGVARLSAVSPHPTPTGPHDDGNGEST